MAWKSFKSVKRLLAGRTMVPLVSQRSASNTQTDQRPKTDVAAWRYRAESLEAHKNMTPAEVGRRCLGVYSPKRPASLSNIYNSSSRRSKLLQWRILP